MAEKAKSPKRAGLLDSAIDQVSTAYESAKEYFTTPDPGSLADKVSGEERRQKADTAIAGATPVKKKEKKAVYQGSSNERVKADADKLKTKSKADIEAIRKRLQAGEKVKVDET